MAPAQWSTATLVVLTLGLGAASGFAMQWLTGGRTPAAPDLPRSVASLGPGRRLAWRSTGAGKISRLQPVEEDIADPGDGEVQVSVRAIGLNFADIYSSIGLYSATPNGSYVPGLEYAGVVTKLGPKGVHGDLKIGDRVYGVVRFGAYASHLNAPSHFARVLPPSWSFAEGAAFPAQSLTAWHGLAVLGNLKKGQAVLINSAAGGVGHLALQICQALGALPVATIGSPAKVDFLRERGVPADQIIVRETSAAGFEAQLRKSLASIGRTGFDVVFDAVGNYAFRAGMATLDPNGRMVTYGSSDYMAQTDAPNWLRIVPRFLSRPAVDPGDLVQANVSVMGFNLIWLTDKVDELNGEVDALLAAVDWRAPHVGSVRPFAELREAMAHLQSGKSVGKVIVEVDHGQQ